MFKIAFLTTLFVLFCLSALQVTPGDTSHETPKTLVEMAAGFGGALPGASR